MDKSIITFKCDNISFVGEYMFVLVTAEFQANINSPKAIITMEIPVSRTVYAHPPDSIRKEALAAAQAILKTNAFLSMLPVVQ
jgi:hypothetical protein